MIDLSNNRAVIDTNARKIHVKIYYVTCYKHELTTRNDSSAAKKAALLT